MDGASQIGQAERHWDQLALEDRSHVQPARHLCAGVFFVDALPKNPSGKLLKRQLREQDAALFGS